MTGTVRDPHVMTTTMTFMTMIKLRLLLPAMKLRVNQSEIRRDGGPKRSLILAVKTIVRMSHLAVSFCVGTVTVMESKSYVWYIMPTSSSDKSAK